MNILDKIETEAAAMVDTIIQENVVRPELSEDKIRSLNGILRNLVALHDRFERTMEAGDDS